MDALDESAPITALSTTVAWREVIITKAEVQKARKIRELQRVPAFPGAGTLAQTLNKSGSANMSVTAADVRLANEIYGPEVCASQGKAREPKNAKSTITRVLYLHGEQNLFVDVFFCRERAYIICVAKLLCPMMTRNVPTLMMNAQGYLQAVLWTVNHIQKRGFTMTDIL